MQESVIRVILGLVLLLLAKRFFDRLTPFTPRVQRLEKDNPALALILGGYLLGMMAVAYGALSVPIPSESTLLFLLILWGKAVSGMLLLLLAGWVNSHSVLHHIDNTVEITGRRNISVGAVQGGMFASSGLIIGAAIEGNPSILGILLISILGQGFLMLAGAVLPDLIGYRHRQWWVEDQNLAMGVALGGHLLAAGIVIRATIEQLSLHIGQQGGVIFRDVAILTGQCVGSALVLQVVRYLNDRLFTYGLRLSNEAKSERYLNAGLYEAIVVILAAGMIHTAISA